MTDVEFLDPHEQSGHQSAVRQFDARDPEQLDHGADPNPPTGGASFRSPAFVVAVVTLVAAITLLVMASFRTVITIEVRSGGLMAYSVDAWGRYNDLGTGTLFVGHGTRYGIALVAIAAVYALVALATAVTAFAPVRLGRFVSLLGRVAIGASGALLGVIACAGLQLDSISHNTHESIRGFPNASAAANLGSCAWLSLTALGAGIIAVAAIRWWQTNCTTGDLQADELTQRLAELDAESANELALALTGTAAPHVALASTSGRWVALDQLPPGRTIAYVYPLTARPDVELPADWDEIPGARGCTPEACGFRDHYAELQAAGVSAVFGISSQTTDYQLEPVHRLGLPFEMLADPGYELAAALDLPTFETAGMRLYQRLTLVLRDGRIEHAFTGIQDPGAHADDVLAWLRR